MSNAIVGRSALLNASISDTVCRCFDSGKGEPDRKIIIDKTQLLWQSGCMFSFYAFIQNIFVNQSFKPR